MKLQIREMSVESSFMLLMVMESRIPVEAAIIHNWRMKALKKICELEPIALEALIKEYQGLQKECVRLRKYLQKTWPVAYDRVKKDYELEHNKQTASV